MNVTFRSLYVSMTFSLWQLAIYCQNFVAEIHVYYHVSANFVKIINFKLIIFDIPAFQKSFKLNILIAESLLHYPENMSFSNTRRLVELNIQRIMESKGRPEEISRVQTSQILKVLIAKGIVFIYNVITIGNIFVYPYPALSFMTSSLTFKTKIFYFSIIQNVK